MYSRKLRKARKKQLKSIYRAMPGTRHRVFLGQPRATLGVAPVLALCVAASRQFTGPGKHLALALLLRNARKRIPCCSARDDDDLSRNDEIGIVNLGIGGQQSLQSDSSVLTDTS